MSLNAPMGVSQAAQAKPIGGKAKIKVTPLVKVSQNDR